MQDATHGNSVSHRAPGSIGQCQSPGRVFKGKKMAGHMGAVRVTSQTLEVVRVDQENNLLLVKGAVPGSEGWRYYRQAFRESPELSGVGALNLNISEPGKGVSERAVDVSEATFGRQFNEALVHQVVVAYMAGARQGTRAQKTRSEVRWRRSVSHSVKRVRAVREPVPFEARSGVEAVLHSPTRPKTLVRKVNRKMYRGAMQSILVRADSSGSSDCDRRLLSRLAQDQAGASAFERAGVGQCADCRRRR